MLVTYPPGNLRILWNLPISIDRKWGTPVTDGNGQAQWPVPTTPARLRKREAKAKLAAYVKAGPGRAWHPMVAVVRPWFLETILSDYGDNPTSFGLSYEML